MEPLLMILVPGLLGGLALALLIAGNRQGTPSIVVPTRLAAPSPSLINMAHIRVEGVGGLGMVGAVVVVAVSDPRIGLATILASVLGAGLALALIAMRRHTGGLPSGGDGPECRSMLGLEDERRRTHLTGVRAQSSSTAGLFSPRRGRSPVLPTSAVFHGAGAWRSARRYVKLAARTS